MKNRSKTYDRGYVDAADKLRVFIESRSKVMYVDHNYASAEVARRAYMQAIKNIRCHNLVRITVSRNELFMIRKDI